MRSSITSCCPREEASIVSIPLAINSIQLNWIWFDSNRSDLTHQMRCSIDCGARLQSILQLRWIDDQQAESKLFQRTSFRTSKAPREKERTRSRPTFLGTWIWPQRQISVWFRLVTHVAGY
jgi:hypothetical protein